MALSFRFIVALMLGSYYGVLMMLRMIFEFFRKGPKVFSGPRYRTRPKVLSDPKYGKSGYLHLKDITMHFVEKGDKSKPLLLMVHGFPEFWYSWRHQLTSELADKFHLVAIDMRGYGQTDKPKSVANYKMKLLVEDIRQAIEALGHTDCYLIGHDWGGAVCWSFVAAHPEMVRRYAALNIPHPGAFTKALQSSLEQFRMSWYMLLFQLPCLPEFLLTRGDMKWMEQMLTSPEFGVKSGRIDQDDLEAFKYTFKDSGGFTGPVNYYRSMMRNPPSKADQSARDKKIKLPVRLIFGDKDAAISVDSAKESAKFCENFDLQLVNGASHWVQQDEPEIVNRLLVEFLTK